ncbi:MAG: DUF3106 domain-containing protein [Burkholderiaceae bacterium]|nr:DUF3106 domain-containing protein [Burkholderiaceae bacterium]
MSLLLVLPILAAILWVRPSFAADPQPAPAPAAAVAAPKVEVKPTWADLTPTQRDVLGPLAPQWPQFDSNHKAKWIAISSKYQGLPPEKQQKFKQSIADWVKMTPEQHRLARESYAKAKKLEPEQKTAQWEQYQQLPEEQKQKLAADAATKKRIANLPALQTKAKTVEPLRQPKKPVTTPVNAAGVPLAPAPQAQAPAPSSGVVPMTNPQPAAPAPINK